MVLRKTCLACGSVFGRLIATIDVGFAITAPCSYLPSSLAFCWGSPFGSLFTDNIICFLSCAYVSRIRQAHDSLLLSMTQLCKIYAFCVVLHESSPVTLQISQIHSIASEKHLPKDYKFFNGAVSLPWACRWDDYSVREILQDHPRSSHQSRLQLPSSFSRSSARVPARMSSGEPYAWFRRSFNLDLARLSRSSHPHTCKKRQASSTIRFLVQKK